MALEMKIRAWNAWLMPTVRSTKPNPDEQIPVALAARIAGIDRSSLAHLVDHGLVPRLDLEAVRALATSGEVAAKTTDAPGYLVIRMDIDPAVQRIVDMSDDELSGNVEGPHRLPGSSASRAVLLCVRSFVIATGHLDRHSWRTTNNTLPYDVLPEATRTRLFGHTAAVNRQRYTAVTSTEAVVSAAAGIFEK
ncbi:MAG: hypothetical protein L0G59_06810 [Kocuria sp.]|nr:hypothetical protein [Kocuria sp.]